jgi:fibronectin-binding autotransporter adhesin
LLGGGSEEIAFSALKSSFGLYWGSVDTYNSLAFYDGNVLVATISGADVAPPMAANGRSNRLCLERLRPDFCVAAV